MLWSTFGGTGVRSAEQSRAPCREPLSSMLVWLSGLQEHRDRPERAALGSIHYGCFLALKWAPVEKVHFMGELEVEQYIGP